MTPVEFRQKTAAPTEPGWHYARDRVSPHMPLEPTEVLAEYRQGQFVRLVCDGGVSLADFDWFGPVTEVREG